MALSLLKVFFKYFSVRSFPLFGLLVSTPHKREAIISNFQYVKDVKDL